VVWSRQREHDESADHGLLVFNLTVLSGGERVPFVSGIEFTAKNVAEDTAAREELIARTGRMAVPVITVDREVVVGFDRGRLQRLLGIK
jgi:glutaredoxin